MNIYKVRYKINDDVAVYTGYITAATSEDATKHFPLLYNQQWSGTITVVFATLYTGFGVQGALLLIDQTQMAWSQTTSEVAENES